MRYIFVKLFLKIRLYWIFVFMVMNAMIAQAAPTRAWLVSKGSSQAVLVGETHLKTAVEFDNYFEEIVKPSFVAAKVALIESVFNTPPQLRQRSYRVMPCLDNYQDFANKGFQRTERLQSAIESMVELMKKKGGNNNYDGLLSNAYPEYLIGSVVVSEFIPNTEEIHRKSSVIFDQYYKGVSLHLMEYANKKKMTSKLRGLDFDKTLRESFCAESESNRQTYLTERIKSANQQMRDALDPPNFKALKQLNEITKTYFLRSVNCIDNPVLCSYSNMSDQQERHMAGGIALNFEDPGYSISIKGRSHAWLPIIVQALDQNKKVFILVGASHLPDFIVNRKKEAGLISLLRLQGYKVQAIHSAADIQNTFLKKSSWFEDLF